MKITVKQLLEELDRDRVEAMKADDNPEATQVYVVRLQQTVKWLLLYIVQKTGAETDTIDWRQE